MNKYLVFRTDRLGDFLVSLILIKSIKRNDASSHISVVASDNNYNYIIFSYTTDYLPDTINILKSNNIKYKLKTDSYNLQYILVK